MDRAAAPRAALTQPSTSAVALDLSLLGSSGAEIWAGMAELGAQGGLSA